MSIHPAAAPAIAALTSLANYQATSPADTAALLDSIHRYGHDSVIAKLLEALDAINSNLYATPGLPEAAARRISGHLNTAAEHISGAACDWIDRAREATGTEWPR